MEHKLKGIIVTHLFYVVGQGIIQKQQVTYIKIFIYLN